VSSNRPSKSVRLLCVGLVLAAGALVVSACQEVPSTQVKSQPYEVVPIEGTNLNRVRLPDEIARRIDLQTAKVEARGKTKIVPHAALIYNPEGELFVYTRPKPETYVRAPVKVSRVVDDQAVLSDGPPAGTVVVTIGAAELLATEYEILNQHP
jgi:hypothetical protein